jgi:hypothetical protein
VIFEGSVAFEKEGRVSSVLDASDSVGKGEYDFVASESPSIYNRVRKHDSR